MDNATLNRLREIKRAPAELVTDNETGIFRGYASIFGVADLGNDVILPGAFATSLKSRTARGVRMLFQHDPAAPIGAWTALREDGNGLRVEGRIAMATQKGREVLELMRAGAVDGLSIGFRTVRARMDRARGARQVIEADLWEISVVTFPMQPGARIEALKGLARALPTTREFERWLVRDAGLTRGDARTVIARGFAHLAGGRDAAGTDTGLAATINRAAKLFSTERTGKPT